MKIGCIGWGSVIWNPGELPIKGTWFTDGPFLPIEFARKSSGNRITLVIVPGYQEVRTLWTLLRSDNAEDAARALALREGMGGNLEKIGVWNSKTKSKNEIEKTIGKWAKSIGLNAVVWTALGATEVRPKGSEPPSEDEVIAYLRGLAKAKAKLAEEYIRNTPRQIDTPYRRRIEREFQWTPLSNI